MGLDQNLFRIKKQDVNDTLKPEFNDNDREEIAYWRKANQIHGWMNDNISAVENCTGYTISKNKLEQLRDICVAVYENNNVAFTQEHLPTRLGFFYGSDDYDDHYYNQVQNSIEQLNDVLNTTNFDTHEIYYWAWW